MTDFKREIKIEINKDINFIVDNLFASEKFVNTVGDEILNGLKQISIILEECKINHENNRYFSIKKAMDIISKMEAYNGVMDLYEGLRLLSEMSYTYFHNTLLEYMQKEEYSYLSNKDMLDVFHMEEFQPDLYEELINIVLNGLDNIGELITIGGYDVRAISSSPWFMLIDAYKEMVGLRLDFDYTKERLDEHFGRIKRNELIF